MKTTSRKFFAELAGSYDRTADFAMLFQDRRWKNWAARWLNPPRGSLVLDIGCGTLILEERLKGYACTFACIDLAPEMVKMGQRKNLGNVALLMNGDAEFLPFVDGSFISVVSCYVAKYVDIEKFAAELARVTRVGARVVIYDFTRPRGPLAPFVGFYVQGGLRLIGKVLGLARRKGAFTFKTLPSVVERTTWDAKIARAMERNGFKGLASARLTAGVVFAYCARRQGSPHTIPVFPITSNGPRALAKQRH